MVCTLGYVNVSRPCATRCPIHLETKAVCTVFVVFAAIVGSLGNASVFYSIRQRRRVNNNMNRLIINMAGCDFVISALLAPIFLCIVFNYNENNVVVNSLFLVLALIITFPSLFSVVSIAICRVALIQGTVKRFTHCKVSLTLAIIWTLTTALSLPAIIQYIINANEQSAITIDSYRTQNLYFSRYLLYVWCPMCAVSFLSITISYVTIACAIQKRPSSIGSALNYAMVTNNHYTTNRDTSLIFTKLIINDFPPSQLNARHTYIDKTVIKSWNKADMKRMIAPSETMFSQTSHRHAHKSNKALVMCFVICVTVLLCWTPFVISLTAQLLTNSYRVIICQVKMCGVSLILLNSALNPFIYYQHNLRFKFLKDYVFCRSRKRNTHCSSSRFLAGTAETDSKQRIHQKTPKLY